MWQIDVQKTSETPASWIFTVTAREDENYTYIVEVDRDYPRQLTGKAVSPLQLVQCAFMFLREQEPFSAILKEFNLRVIEEYFPQFPEQVRNHFTS